MTDFIEEHLGVFGGPRGLEIDPADRFPRGRRSAESCRSPRRHIISARWKPASQSVRRPGPRHGSRSTIVTSQAPVGAWYDLVGNPTVSDAVLDRLVHIAHRIVLTGESLRKRARQKIAA